MGDSRMTVQRGEQMLKAESTVIVNGDRSKELWRESINMLSWNLNARQIWDIELLMSGAFAPLNSFLSKEDYESVCSEMRLADGTVWPIPIVLDVTREFADRLKVDDQIVLRHPEGMILAVLRVEQI